MSEEKTIGGLDLELLLKTIEENKKATGTFDLKPIFEMLNIDPNNITEDKEARERIKEIASAVSFIDTSEMSRIVEDQTTKKFRQGLEENDVKEPRDWSFGDLCNFGVVVEKQKDGDYMCWNGTYKAKCSNAKMQEPRTNFVFSSEILLEDYYEMEIRKNPERILSLIANSMAAVEKHVMRVAEITLSPKDFYRLEYVKDYEKDGSTLWGALVHCDANMRSGDIRLKPDWDGEVPEDLQKVLEGKLISY